MAFLLAGFVCSIFLFKQELLRKRITWVTLMVFILLILSNLVWQFLNDFPILQHRSKLYENQLDKQKNWYNYRVFVCREIHFTSAELKYIFEDKIF